MIITKPGGRAPGEGRHRHVGSDHIASPPDPVYTPLDMSSEPAWPKQNPRLGLGSDPILGAVVIFVQFNHSVIVVGTHCERIFVPAGRGVGWGTDLSASTWL